MRARHAVNAALKRAVKRAKLDPALTVHDTRHIFASHWVTAGSLYKLRDLLGQSSIKMTKRYAHLIPGAWVEEHRRVRLSGPRLHVVGGGTKAEQFEETPRIGVG